MKCVKEFYKKLYENTKMSNSEKHVVSIINYYFSLVLIAFGKLPH